MYQAPDFVRVDVTVRNSFSGSHCPYDEGTDYTKAWGSGGICMDGGVNPGEQHYSTYPQVLGDNFAYQCYSTLDE